MALPDFARVLSIHERVSAPLGRWLPTQQHEALGERLHTKASRLQPRIMVYGIYNAGKSTLLNALMGRAEAAMADRPETAVVTEYPWQGYTLLDTPGIDAPIEHEDVTNNQLQDCEVVLFVVAAGGATDEASTWKRLIDIVASGRRLILIVNNKAGIPIDSRDFVGINDNLRRHLQSAAEARGIQNILEAVPVHWVNAKAALKGRLENKPALVDLSGLPQLEDALADFLQESDTGTIFIACRNDLIDAIEQAELRLHQTQSSAPAQALAKAKAQVENERTRLISVLNEHLDRSCQRSKSEIVALINDVAQHQASGNANQAMEDGASHVVKTLGDSLMTTLEIELPKTQRSLSEIGEKLAESTFVHANASLNASLEGSDASDESTLTPALKEALKKVPLGNVKELTEQGVKAALELGKEFLPKLFKGIGPKTMGRWASAAGRWAGPLMQAGMAIYDIYQAIRTEQSEKAALARQAKAIDDSASAFIGDLRLAYQLQIGLVVEQVFNPMNEWISSQSSILTLHHQENEHDRLTLGQALLELRREY